MIRAALYARYSSDQQSSASIADQQRICRERAERERWQLVGSYEDAAISGASMILRPGIQSLLADAQAGKFDIVVAEALDRVSRDQADVATLFKHLQFARVPLVTLAEGEISELHVGLKGTMNALFLKDLAKKTHRGLRGRVEKGFSAGAVGYGYRMVRRLTSEGELVRGEREIDPVEALVIERIFTEFAAGKSPGAIARDLNADGVTGPAGKPWRDTSIRGDVRRGTGILNNELYVGVRAWNHKHSVKDPSTGKEVMRLNPESEWLRNAVPELRIVSDDLWQAAKRQQQALAERYTAVKEAAQSRSAQGLRRPAYLLSGLLECGVCGETYAIVVGDRYGCVGHHRRGSCTNNRTIRREDLESRALAGIAERLVSADKIEAAVAAYAAYINRQNRERRIQADADRRGLARIERAVAGIMVAIEDGLYQPAMKARMAELDREKAEITARLAEAPADVPDVHPGIAEIYKRKVAALTDTLADPNTRLDASSDIRSLVGKIVLHPGGKRGEVHATLHGSLMGILDFVNDNPQPRATRVITKASPGSRG
ncbi:resolvase [Sphingopyxis sp. H038]|uniref:recombinase family protein n=1 Tax=unclassified Sphingopyxis TaxID=2614943 RepID=UPI000731E016|nr:MULTISPECIES: recombinase family protein [unclassified Sphingopyxis]KTD99963.1 resolvase [Sphingopyxis sp. H012]KTE07202.1 resolvase [Sphingopyxis sp. H053]KTE09025.1 resolvase [Sphingopyxis sp. H093]KTE25331.1 resolvase [Sphingopyxis sp. H080]KTE36325.1 resolvase [Sphingopyxis sp. H038]